jgi:methionyl-tRNA formyltransferase|tara:strand:+ start:10727 stop:11368 length:642 start_codon:yes stop_codon:yes gene_type:complete
MFIQILVDNKKSWIMDHVPYIIQKLNELGHKVHLVHDSKQIKKGDTLFLLSCEKIFNRTELNKHNIVIHASELPTGKGFSPMTWQILEGKNEIPLTLFEANLKIDSGKIYFKDKIQLNGGELIDEIRKLMADKICTLVIKFINNIDCLLSTDQIGEDSFYRRRRPSDSFLDINKTIKEQFNLLRVVDNERYPAFFTRDNTEYIVKIYKKENRE